MVIQLARCMHSVLYLQHITYCCKWKKSCTSFFLVNIPLVYRVSNPSLVVVWYIFLPSNQHVFPYLLDSKKRPIQTLWFLPPATVRPHPNAPHRLHPMSSVSSGGLPHLGLPSSHRCCIPGTAKKWYTLEDFTWWRATNHPFRKGKMIRTPNLQGIVFQPLIFRGVTVDAIEMLWLHDTHPTTKNYTSVDPKQFTASKFRLKPVILISECFCSRCGHTNQHPPPTWRETTGDKTTSEPKKPTTPTNTHPPHEGRQPETMGDNGRQDHFRAQDGGHTNQHPPPTWRETTGDNGRQRETRPLQSPRSRPHQPTPTPHMKGDNRRQRETTGDNTTSEPKKPTTPTNTHPPHEGRQPETMGDKSTSEPKKPTTPTNTHPPHEGRQPETMGDNGRQDHFRAQEADHTNQHQGGQI